MQRTQITAYITEEEKARLNILAAAEQLTASGWIGYHINNAFFELYGGGARALVMESAIRNASGRHTVKDASGKNRRVA
jgi:hypothetical protein